MLSANRLARRALLGLCALVPLLAGTAEALATTEARLLASNGAADDEFGSSVALAGDRAIVGAPLHDAAGGSRAGSANVLDLSDTTNPAAPSGLRAEVYSRTAVELFWERPDTSGLIIYEVIRNGVVLTTTDGVSYFDDTLNRDTAHTYEVVAIDRQGNRSTPSTVMLTTPDGGPLGAAPGNLKDSIYAIPKLRVAQIIPLMGNLLVLEPELKKEVEKQLHYHKELGYTHILYYIFGLHDVDYTYQPASDGKQSQWLYKNGNYKEGETARALREAKTLIEANGLKMIPVLFNTLSHAQGVILAAKDIYGDNSIAEYTDVQWNKTCGVCENVNKETTIGYCSLNQKLYCSSNKFFDSKYHIAYVGNYPEHKNKSIDELFRENLKILAANWGDTTLGGPFPRYIHLQHDELGVGDNLIKNGGRSEIFTSSSRAELIARELAYRVKQLEDVFRFDSQIQIMLWGDSMVPAAEGEIYGLAGHNGNGILENLAQLIDRERFIIMPWRFQLLNGEELYTNLVTNEVVIHDKAIQLEYLDRLGYSYIPTSGEGDFSFFGLSCEDRPFERVAQSAYEWIRASRRYPKYLSGYANLTWNRVNICTNVARVGYSAAIQAYSAWTYPHLPTRNLYRPNILRNLDYKRSSLETTWVEHDHYKRPPRRLLLKFGAGLD